MIPKNFLQIKQAILKTIKTEGGSKSFSDPEILKQYTDDQDFPFLVSFPRTGSHWLRMLMELYFARPSLVRVFYYPEKKNYLTLHTHDMDLDVYRNNVIYLYRNPVPTIYSQMRYEKENLDDPERVKFWADLYRRHLVKWLLEEKQSQKKTIIRYENMCKDLKSEFSKIVSHFEENLDWERLEAVAKRVSKQEVKKKTLHDEQVIALETSYEMAREVFTRKYLDMITSNVFQKHPTLKHFFN